MRIAAVQAFYGDRAPSLQISVKLRENFGIADIGPIAGNFDRLNFLSAKSEISNRVRQLVFAARRRFQFRDVIENAPLKRVDTGVVPRTRRLAGLRFFTEIGQLEFVVEENRAALTDVVAPLHTDNGFRAGERVTNAAVIFRRDQNVAVAEQKRIGAHKILRQRNDAAGPILDRLRFVIDLHAELRSIAEKLLHDFPAPTNDD